MPTISFTVTAQEAGRIQDAVGKLTGLPGAATAEQSRQFIIQKVKNLVLETERENYFVAHTPTSIEPT
jgi:hypothetical protein